MGEEKTGWEKDRVAWVNQKKCFIKLSCLVELEQHSVSLFNFMAIAEFPKEQKSGSVLFWKFCTPPRHTRKARFYSQPITVSLALEFGKALIKRRGFTHSHLDFVWKDVYWNRTKKQAKQGKKRTWEQMFSGWEVTSASQDGSPVTTGYRRAKINGWPQPVSAHDWCH